MSGKSPHKVLEKRWSKPRVLGESKKALKTTEVERLKEKRCRAITMTGLRKCNEQPEKKFLMKERMTMRNGFRCYYLTKKEGRYRGGWKDNLRDGLGTQFNYEKNEINEGFFEKDKKNGYGIISKMKPNGIQYLYYLGEFVDDKPSGFGELHTPTYHYMGNVVNDKAEGQGMAWLKDGTFYHGNWHNGKKTGTGMMIYKYSRYEGNWFEDKKHGYGQYYFFDRGQLLEGVWVADACVTGTVRNIKYRQAAVNPVKYAMPKLMLKDWGKKCTEWKDEAIARGKKYMDKVIGESVQTGGHKRYPEVTAFLDGRELKGDELQKYVNIEALKKLNEKLKN